MIDYGRGYSIRKRVMRVDRDTWADAGELDGVDSVTILRKADGDAPKLESGTVSVVSAPDEAFDEGWYRVEAILEQDGEVELAVISTLHLEAVSGTLDRGADFRTLTGTSVLEPAASKKLRAGYTIPKGSDGSEWARTVLAGLTPAPVRVEGSFRLDSYYVVPQGKSVLWAVWRVLDGAGWCMTVDGDGTVTIKAKPSESSLMLDSANAHLLDPGIERYTNLGDTYNRYIAKEGASMAEAQNADEGSPTSIQTVGFAREFFDASPVRVNGETLQAYAERNLAEKSVLRTEYRYTRDWWPGVTPFHIVTAGIGSIGFEGELRVQNQNIKVGERIEVVETAAREEVTYPWRS